MGLTSLIVLVTVYTIGWWTRDNNTNYFPTTPIWDFLIQEKANLNSNLTIVVENLLLWSIPFTFIYLIGYVIQFTKHYMSKWKLNKGYPLFYPLIVKEILRSIRGIIIASLLEIYMSNYSALYSQDNNTSYESKESLSDCISTPGNGSGNGINNSVCLDNSSSSSSSVPPLTSMMSFMSSFPQHFFFIREKLFLSSFTELISPVEHDHNLDSSMFAITGPMRKAIFSILFLYLWGDLYFYVTHFLLHWNNFIFIKIHKIHHESHNPTPFSGHSMHVVESTIYFFSSLLMAYLFQVPHWMFRLLHKGLILFPLEGHAGFGSWEREDSHNHYLHHAFFEKNYGSSPLWDHIFGTNFKLEEKHRKRK